MITVCVDDRVRLISSILALTVGNAEIEGWAHPHPLRLAIQKFLKPFRSHPCVLMFDQICQRIPAEIPSGSLFYPVATLLKKPPRITWDTSTPYSRGIREGLEDAYGTWIQDEPYRTLIRPLIQPVLDVSDKLPCLLSDFYSATKIAESWEEHRRWWKEAVQQCREILSSRQISQWLGDFYGETGGGFFLIPNLTDPPSDSFGFTRRNRTYAIVGPPSVPKRIEACDSDHQYGRRPGYLVNTAFHEFSHGLVKSYLVRSSELIHGTESLSKRNRLRGWFASTYPIWRIQFEEIFIRASTALFLAQRRGESAAEEFLEGEKKQHGIYAIDEFYERLHEYIEGKRSGRYTDLAEYLKSWSRSIGK
ncbi:MAG: DUF4932 domain-containing protein [Candidatus Bathyarchaeota archaeon]|nr:DUF4932 domain-containing protein [Candidatus Bathyarchaeota archaeon]